MGYGISREEYKNKIGEQEYNKILIECFKLDIEQFNLLEENKRINN